MVRLLMEGGRPGLPDIPLQPGLNRLGRVEDNDYQIDDDSVSSYHCEIEFKEGVITVRDLGSTNGTFLDGRPIQEAVLRPGQVLSLGAVKMVFQDDAAGQPAATGAPPPPMVRALPPRAKPAAASPADQPDAGVCCRHSGAAAQWRCVVCGTPWCPACVKTTITGMLKFRNCPQCGGSCLSAAEYARLKTPTPTDFFAVWRSAFSYPLKKDGLILLTCGIVVFSFLSGARWVMFTGVKFMGMLGMSFWLIFFLILVMSVGYTFSFMQSIIQSSARGDPAMPDWPEISVLWDDLVVPFFQFACIWALCLGPGIVIMWLILPLAGLPLVCLGLFCLPMAILTVAMADTIAGFNPLMIFAGIGKAPKPYLAVCGIFLVIIAVVHGIQMFLNWTEIPVLPTVVSTAFGLYGVTVEMRLLGLFYLTNKSKLAWFE
jgi:hypothetical protein